MKRLTTLGVMLVAVLATVVVAAASASAAELPEFLGGNVKFTGASKTATLAQEGGATVTCTSTKSSGEITGLKTATATLEFEGCESAGVKCKGLSDTVVGKITVTSPLDLVWDVKGGGAAAVLFLIPTVHFACSVLLVEVTGCNEALIKPVNTSTAAYTLTVEQSGGKNKETTWFDHAGTAHTCALSASFNHETAKSAGEAATEPTITLAAAREVMA